MSYLDERADLAGRVAVVVGGGGGIGRACAVDLARAGMHLALADRDPAALDEVAAVIADAGAEVMTSELDARDADALSAFFDQADTRFGARCDVLVNVVGGTFRQPFAESNPRGWDALIRTNFTWLLHSTQLAVARMRRQGGGSIINITSIEAHRAAPGYAVYAAMKAAVTSLTRTLAVELAPEQIRVNTIAPDYIATPGLDSLAGSANSATSELQHRIGTPMGRIGTFEDAGGCALFLASNLSSFVTGTTLHPDGGALASAGWFNWPTEGFLNHPPHDVLARLLDD
ncbi:MAG: SDR family oxidoreductase [Acidimicrobiales bacterium]|jgi:NAD(P)-dependent dehydrogenase (short-subunit alcohol dehydrogenase family)